MRIESRESTPIEIESINAVTFEVGDMALSVAFYQALGFVLSYGGPEARFTSLEVGQQRLNLEASPEAPDPGRPVWGRVIVWVNDVDAVYERALADGLQPAAPPRDAEWGERYFHLRDPDGHELSFARPLRAKGAGEAHQ